MNAAAARRFFIAGAPKAGTTSLYHYLDQHPQIYMSPIKEPHFFADEIRVENFSAEMQAMSGASTAALRAYLDGPVVEKFSGGPVSRWDDYRKLFARVSNETAIGEASTCYMWSPTAPANIAAAFPDAKILMVLRNPSDRAFSQYRHMLSFATKRVSFSDHLSASLACSGARISELFPFLQFGLYGEQIARYLTFFPRSRLHIAFYEEYLRAPDKFLRDICAFLDVDPGFAFDRSAKHMQAAVPHSYALNTSLKSLGVWNLVRTLTPPAVRAKLRRLIFQPAHALCLSREERRRLCDFYRPDIQRLSVLLKQDLSAWLTQ
jgi:sulfotransferase family protein